jgi:Mg2+/Co2+ transporter CorB
MDPDLLLTGVLILFLILLSGFFSGSETALTAASPARLHQLGRKGNKRAQLVTDLRARNDKLIGSILIGNNIVNIFASVLATSALIELFGQNGIAYATIAMTVLIVLFAEVLPKTYAISNADRVALGVAPVLRVFVWLLTPFSLATRGVVKITLLIFGVRVSDAVDLEEREEELRGLIELHEGPDEETQQERAMLRSILDLDDVEVSEIMTHRRNMAMIDADLPVEQVLDEVMSSPYTRIPLWRGEPDEIVGVLHVKALLKAIRDIADGNTSKLDILETAADPWFIPETTTLLDQLQEFRQRREHFAVVVDEYGALQGVVTLEDILEEIVGDISDEHDIPVAGVRPQTDGSIVVDGTVTLRDLNREFDWLLPDEDASTVAGLVLHEARVIPTVGQEFSFHGFRFKVLRRQRNQITQLRMSRLTPESEKP